MKIDITKSWIFFSVIGAIIISFSDLLRKHLTNIMKIDYVICVPLIIAGITSLFYLMTNNKLSEIKNMSSDKICLLILLSLTSIMISYFVTKSIALTKNIGSAKTILSLNVVISSIVSIYIFKGANINKELFGGIILVLIGSHLVISNS